MNSCNKKVSPTAIQNKGCLETSNSRGWHKKPIDWKALRLELQLKPLAVLLAEQETK